MNYRYRGVPTLKNPFDLALYLMLFNELKPRTLIEIGSHRGGSALWLADMSRNLGIDTHVYSVDIVRVEGVHDERISFFTGDAHALHNVFSANQLSAMPHPWLIIEDSDHRAATTLAVLRFFDPFLQTGDYMVVEDGILTDMRVAEDYGGGPRHGLDQFLAEAGTCYEVDRTYCDYFGTNVTWNVNGWLRCIR